VTVGMELMRDSQDLIEKLKALEAERKKLLLEIDELLKITEAKAKALDSEISILRQEAKELKTSLGIKEVKPTFEPLIGTLSRGTFQMTATKATEYVTMGLFYIAVTRTNSLTKTDIGSLSILTFLSSIIALITGLALPTALTKFASENIGKNDPEKAASTQKTVAKTVITLSIIGFIVATILSEQLSQYLFGSIAYMPLIVFMLIYTLLNSMITLFSSTLQALYLFGRLASVTLLFIVTSRTTAVALALLHMGLEGVIIGYVTGAIIALAAALVFIRGKLPKTTHNASIKPILTFSLPLFISSLTLFVLNWADVIIVTAAMHDYSLTGIYYIAVNSVTALSILYIPMTTTILPALSAKHGLKKPEDITSILKTSSRYLMYIVVPCCLVLAVVSPSALAFFYGSSYASGATALSILSLTTIITAFYGLFTTALTAIGKTSKILTVNIISATLTIIILTAIVPFFQIAGAAATRLTTQIVATAIAFYLLRNEVKIQIGKEALWKSVLASIATIPFLLILETTLSGKLSTTQTLFVEVTLAAMIYVFSLYILKALKTQDFELLRQALPKPLTKYINRIEKTMIR
jgi:O-antigen/teichoic acid export membrane protein